MKPLGIASIVLALIAATVIIVGVGLHDQSKAEKPLVHPTPLSVKLPNTPESYLGVYLTGVPHSYAKVTAFTKATSIRPNVLVYYNALLQPFQADFAIQAARHGAVPLVQIDPEHVSLAAIAGGQYDVYLNAYAAAVRSYRHAVIMSFGHEMNGYWYPWSNRHSSATSFVAAWQHIVTVFRGAGADNVTWLWTVNIIDKQGGIPDPRPWWPGKSYVTSVGIDGYYRKSSMTFAPLFGPTIVAVRALTSVPILIAEAGVAGTARQPAQIGDLFTGIRTYGLLGISGSMQSESRTGASSGHRQ